MDSVDRKELPRETDKKITESIARSEILVVEDSDTSFEIIRESLSCEFSVTRTVDAESAIKLISELSPDLLIIDYRLPRMDGLELCKWLRLHPSLDTTPVIMITSNTETDLETAFWKAGCNDFICKPFSPHTLVHRTINQLKYKKTVEELREAAMVDSLTKVFNRRYLDAMMTQLVNRSDTKALSVLMIDIDWFKRFNDTYGHFAGDVALKQVAEVLKNSVSRSTDFVTRLGGEEFCLVLPHTDSAGVMQVANRIVDGVRGENIKHAQSPLERLSISVGAVTDNDPGKDWKSIFEAADEMLYKAKKAGRNRIEQGLYKRAASKADVNV